MSKVLRMRDRVSVKIDDITIKVSPLSYLHKMEIQELMIQASQGDMVAAMRASRMLVKHCVKSIEGVEDYQGNSFELDFEEDNSLKEDCIDDLFNLQETEKMITVCSTLLHGKIDNELLNPMTGKPLEGVSFGAVEGN